MIFSTNNEKIEKYLDELASEYKILLYKALVSRSKTLDELSVSELLRLDNEIKKPLLEDYQKLQSRRRMLLFSGLFYMFAGVFFYFSYKIIAGYVYDRDTMIFLVCGLLTIIGFFISLYSLAFQTLGEYSPKSGKDYEGCTALLKYEVVTKWRELEGIVNDISLNANIKTPRSSIDFLLENHFIDEKEHTVLKKFLKMRNNIVHSNGSLYSERDIKDIIKEMDRIIDRIKKVI